MNTWSCYSTAGAEALLPFSMIQERRGGCSAFLYVCSCRYEVSCPLLTLHHVSALPLISHFFYLRALPFPSLSQLLFSVRPVLPYQQSFPGAGQISIGDFVNFSRFIIVMSFLGSQASKFRSPYVIVSQPSYLFFKAFSLPPSSSTAHVALFALFAFSASIMSAFFPLGRSPVCAPAFSVSRSSSVSFLY